MSYQDPIYNQNGKIIRNSTAPVVKTSSDVCVFSNPLFTMIGGDKIQCVDITCNISGQSFSDIYTAATECFINNNLSSTCFNNIEWATRIYEDNDLVYHNTFYTSTALVGDSATFNDFSGSVTTAFDSLGYDYELSGTSYTLTQIQGVNNLKVAINTEIDFDANCPLTGVSSGSTFTGTCEDIDTIVCDESFNGLLVSDHNVFPISGQTSIDLDFLFSGDTESFIETNAKFKFEIYKFNNTLGFFNQPAVFISPLHEWSSISGTSAFTETIPVEDLEVDGSYLVKGYYLFDNCNEFAKLLGLSYSTEANKLGDRYQLYRTDRDFYFAAFTAAEPPFIEPGVVDDNNFGALSVNSQILPGGTTEFAFPKQAGDLVVNLNGLTLAKDIDYVIKDLGGSGGLVLQLSGDTFSGDMLTYVYTNTDEPNNNIKLDVIDIGGPVPQGPTNTQGDNDVFFNTTTNKFEVYTQLTPVANNDIVVTLNGITLANNIDYYLSSTNPKRVILEGTLLVGDIVNVWYNTNLKAQGNIFSDSITVEWSIVTAPKGGDGRFILQLATDTTFNNIINSVEVDYIKNQTGYSTILGLIGSAGDKVYYRVINEKKFVDICGGPIFSTANSEIVDITIQTNAINSY